MFTHEELQLLIVALNDYNEKTNSLILKGELEISQAMQCTSLVNDINEKINNLLTVTDQNQ